MGTLGEMNSNFRGKRSIKSKNSKKRLNKAVRKKQMAARLRRAAGLGRHE